MARLVLVGVTGLFCRSVQADTFFTLVDSGYIISGTLPNTPSIFAPGQYFRYNAVPLTYNGTLGAGNVTFFNPAGPYSGEDFGVSFTTTGAPSLSATFGPILYSGPERNPTISYDTFGMTNTAAESVTLTLADASAIPEPNSLALLGIGVAGFIALVRRRKTRLQSV